MSGPEGVREAHKELATSKGVTQLLDLQQRDGQAWFLFSDIDRNWWELSS